MWCEPLVCSGCFELALCGVRQYFKESTKMTQCLLGFLENCYKYYHGAGGSEYFQGLIAERLEWML